MADSMDHKNGLIEAVHQYSAKLLNVVYKRLGTISDSIPISRIKDSI